MLPKYDVIVVGSGPAGAHAARPLVKRGLKVAMLDGGVISEHNLEEQFEGDFEKIRRERPMQYKLFLSDDLSGIPIKGGSHSNMMASGTRAYVSKFTEELLPVDSPALEVSQSLAKGGLSETWGAACGILRPEEIEFLGIPKEEMPLCYNSVIKEIGLSGKSEGYQTQQAVRGDWHARSILKKCSSIRSSSRFSIEAPLLALLTSKLNGREATSYDDLDYCMNRGKSIYRARFTIEKLQKNKNFSYFGNQVVEKVNSKGKMVEVTSKSLDGRARIFTSKKVVLAAGAINTVRILLRSMNKYNSPVNFMTKRHILMPCIHLRSLGMAGDRKRTSLCQLFIHDSENEKELDNSFTQIYSYKSLMLFKLLDYSPAPLPETFSMLSLFSPSILIADTRFPSFGDGGTKLVLLKSPEKGDYIKVLSRKSRLSPNHKKTLKELRKFLRSLGVFPLLSLDTPLGSTAHYAGGVPFSDAPSGILSSDRNGRLHQDNNIIIADASTWGALPAKPPALTIMANAYRVGSILAKEM